MAAPIPFQGFSTMVEISLGDSSISFVSSYTLTPTNDANYPVKTMSNSQNLAGYGSQQYGYIISISMPVASNIDFNILARNIAADASTQIILRLNKPNSNGGELDFSGGTYILNNVVFMNQSWSGGEGSNVSSDMSFIVPEVVVG